MSQPARLEEPRKIDDFEASFEILLAGSCSAEETILEKVGDEAPPARRLKRAIFRGHLNLLAGS